MFTELRIGNFKGFANEKKINLTKINLFYGPNSAGKSAILEALLLMRQSIRRSNLHYDRGLEPLLFNGSYVDLGSFLVAVNSHDLDRTLSFGASYRIMRPFIGDTFEPETQHFDFHINWDKESKSQVLERCVYRVDSSPENTVAFERYRKSNGDYSVRPVSDIGFKNIAEDISQTNAWRSENEEDDRKLSADYDNWSFLPGMVQINSGPLQALVRARIEKLESKSQAESEKEDEVESPEEIAQREMFKKLDWEYQTLRSWRGMMEDRYRDTFEKLSTIRYLGPTRRSPTRVERLLDRSVTEVGKDGRGVASILHRNPKILAKVNEYFEKLSMPYKLKIGKLNADDGGTTGEILAIQLIDLRSKVILSLEDVGYGISQVLPLLVQSAMSKSDLILIEQPELHLHPAIQANFSEVLIDGISQENSNQFFIETHSEHLILRLQRRIRSGSLAAEDVNVFYVESSEESGTRIHHIELDKDGEFIGLWPQGFFPERLDELLGD